MIFFYYKPLHENKILKYWTYVQENTCNYNEDNTL